MNFNRMIFTMFIFVILMGCVATGNNKFVHEGKTSEQAYRESKKYCEKNDTNFDECMDRQYDCAGEVGIITGIAYAKTNQQKQANERKAYNILKQNNAWERWMNQDMSYCELVEMYRKDWLY